MYSTLKNEFQQEYGLVKLSNCKHDGILFKLQSLNANTVHDVLLNMLTSCIQMYSFFSSTKQYANGTASTIGYN